MGEDNKEEQKVEKEDEKKEDLPEIVLKVDMHCEACARKVARALKGFQGVEEVTTDSKAGRVVVKGKAADPFKVLERLQKKSGRKVELISPLPKPPEATKQEEEEEAKAKEEPPKEEKKKDEPPAPITVELKVRMHCEACAQVVQKRIRTIQGVETVEADVGSDKVMVKGVIDPQNLVGYVYKRTGKHATIIVKEEEKKEEEKKDGGEKEKEKDGGEKEKEKDGEGEVEEGKGEDDGGKLDIKKSDYCPPSEYYMDYVYAYPPQIFSDDNPNACSLM